jgi:O-antigen ligase
VLLQSRSAMLTIGATAVWLVAMCAWRWRSRLALVALVLIIAGVGLVVAQGPGVTTLVARAAESRETGIRRAGWSAAWSMARDHPVLGVGLGGYRQEYAARGLGLDSAHAYNLGLHALAEGGVVGLLAIALVWGRVLWVSARAASRSRTGASALAVHAMLVAFLVRSQSEHFLANLSTSFRLLLLVALLFGLAEGLAASARRGERQRERTHG